MKSKLFPKKAIQAMLNFPEPIVKLKLVRNEILPLSKGSRKGIYDMLAEDERQRFYIVELNRWFKKFWLRLPVKIASFSIVYLLATFLLVPPLAEWQCGRVPLQPRIANLRKLRQGSFSIHLTAYLGRYDKIGFQGCKAARHDDPIHVQM